MNVRPQRVSTSASSMSIGAVLERLSSEFPDVTVSKIRFLESEGLVTPERTQSGYRRFSLHDMERLRFVLSAQRDHYLPLKVIKERLQQADSNGDIPYIADITAGKLPVPPRHLLDVSKVTSLQAEPVETAADREQGAEDAYATRPRQTRVSVESLLQRTGIDKEFLLELRKANLLSPNSSGFYSDDDVDLVIAINSLAKYGLEVRHLRMYKSAADRQADLIAQIAKPRFKSVHDGRARTEDLARELMVETERLQRLLLKACLRRSLS